MPAEPDAVADPAEVRRGSPVDFILLTERIVREARTAKAAAVGDDIVRLISAALRGVRRLPSIFQGAFALRDAVTPVREYRRTRGFNRYR